MKYIKKTFIIFITILMSLFFLEGYVQSDSFKHILLQILNTSGLNVEFSKIKIEKLSEIKIENLKVKDIDKKIVIDSKYTVAKLNLLLPSRLLRIDVNDAVVNLERSDNNHFNIFDILEKKIDKNPPLDRASRLGRLYINNSQLNYVDKSFKEKIHKKLFNINGFLETSKSRGFILEARGNDENEIIGIKLGTVIDTKQSLSSLFDFEKNDTEKRKNYYVNFDFENVNVDKSISQYIPIDLIKVTGGIINGDISLNNYNPEKNLKITGKLDVKDGKLSYVDYENNIENVNAKINFGENEILVNGRAVSNDENINVNVNYNQNNQELLLKLNFEDFSYSNLSKYKILKDLNLSIEGKINGELELKYSQIDKKIDIISMFNSKNIKYNGYNFENFSSNMKLSNNQILTFENTKFYFNNNINGFNIKNNVKIDKIDYDIKEKKGSGIFSILNNKSDYDIEKIEGNIYINEEGFVNVDFSSREILGNLNINTKTMQILLNTQGKNSFNIKYNEQRYRVNPFITNLVIDLKKQNILQRGKIETSLVLLDNNLLGTLKTKIDINDGMYNVSASAKELMGMSLDLKVNLIGDGTKFKGNYEIFSPYGTKGIEYENLKIIGTINDLSELDLDMNIYSEEIWLGYQRLKNVNGKLKLKNDILTIEDISNNKIKLTGFYNLKDKYFDISGQLKNYIIYNTSNPDINLYVDSLNGKLNGTLDKIEGVLNLTNSKTYIKDKYVGDVEGNLKIENNIIDLKALTFRDNAMVGIYDLKSGIIDMMIHLDEKNISELSELNGLDFGLKTDMILKGKLDDFELLGNITLNNINLKGFKIPTINGKLDYKNGDINRIFKYGKLDIGELEFLGDNNEVLFKTSTNLDFENINVDYRLQNQKFSLDSVKDLREKGYSGEVDLSFILNGKPEQYFMDLKLKSDKLMLAGFQVEKIDVDIQMNNDGLSIGEFYLEYEKNPLLINGYVEFSPLNYNLGFFAENFNLDFLGLNRDVKNANGILNVDIVFSNNETNGKILLKDFNYTLKDKTTDVIGVNADINILNRKLSINRLNGGYNGGYFNIKGDLDVPIIPDDFTKTKKVQLGDFEINALLNNVGIKYGKDIDFTLTGDISFTENNLIGLLNINSGEIRSIPNFNGEEKISEAKKNKILEKKTIVEGFIEEVIDKVVKQYDVYLSLQAKKDFKLNISSLSLVNSIKGDIIGDTRIHYNKGEINLFGDILIKKGNFILNGNKFNLINGNIRFVNFDETLENMNPLVDFEASTVINGEKISIGMNGNLKSSEIVFKSDSNLSKNQILSLLAFNLKTSKFDEKNYLNLNEKENNTTRSDENKVIIGTVLDSALNKLIFSSVIGKIGETFGLTNITINTGFNKNNSSNGGYTGIAKFYIQDSIYKNKLFWNAEIKLPFQATKSPEKNEKGGYSDPIGYNIWLNYDFIDGIGIKIGGETIRMKKGRKNEDNENEINITDKINYYFGVSFSKRADTFIELMKKIFYRKKLEILTK